jgi:hypothetical protein
MNGCACLLLYTLLLSCSDACGLKVGMSPGPAFGRITLQQSSQRDSLRDRTGISPMLSPQNQRNPASQRALQSTTAISVLASAGGSAGRHCTTDAAPMQSSFPSTDGASQVRRSEGAPESTLEMEPRSTHLPPLQGWVDFFMHFLGFRFAPPQASIIRARLRRLRASVLGHDQKTG